MKIDNKVENIFYLRYFNLFRVWLCKTSGRGCYRYYKRNKYLFKKKKRWEVTWFRYCSVMMIVNTGPIMHSCHEPQSKVILQLKDENRAFGLWLKYVARCWVIAWQNNKLMTWLFIVILEVAKPMTKWFSCHVKFRVI